MSSDAAILVEFVPADASAEELDRATRALRRELLDVDAVQSVSRATGGPAPDGSRGIGVEAVGALLVSAEPTLEVLKRLLDVVRSWLGRAAGGDEGSGDAMRITVNGHTIELTPTAEQQQALVEKFLAEAVRPQGS